MGPATRGLFGRIRPWLVAVVVVALCGGGGWLALRDPLTPEQVVHRYFEALADRDADEARSYLARHPDEDVETVLLGDDTVEHEDYTPPDHLEIQELAPESALLATMRVTYRVAGTTFDREFRLTRDYPEQSWRIYRGWFSLPANTRTAFPLIVAGTLVPKSDVGQVVAFPGAYVVRVARNPIVEASPLTVVAGAGEAPALRLRLRGNGQPELERQVREHLDGCAARPDPEPTSCPFERLPDVDYPPTVQRRIVTYPSVELLLDGGDMLVVFANPGLAEVRDPAAGSSSPIAEEQFAVTGSLRVDGERFTYVPG